MNNKANRRDFDSCAKTTGDILHALRSYVCNFIDICEFEFKLSSGNA